MIRRIVFTFILLAGALATRAAEPTLDWPATAAAQHARAWFAAVALGETAMRPFLSKHYAAAALAEKPLDARLARWQSLVEDLGVLVPMRVLSTRDDLASVVARSPAKGEVRIEFRCDPKPPHGLLALGIELGGPGGNDAPPPPPVGPPLDDARAVTAMSQVIEAAAKDGGFSGVLLLARGGRPLATRAVGLAERRFAVPNRDRTRFNLGSIGKIFTRIAVAQLAERGKLALDDPLSKYLPDFPHASEITIDMLVRHRSGVGDFFNQRFDEADRSKLRHNRDYLPLFRDQPLWFAPGTVERYSNGGYVLLGEVIAKASGEDYYDYLAKHVFAPAGMEATAAIEADVPVPEVAMGYTTGEDGKSPLRENVYTRPARGSAAGGSYATAADLLKLDQALLGGKLCGSGWSSWVTGTPRPDQGAPAASGEKPGFGFAGGAPGIAAEWMHEGDLTLIVLANLDPPVIRPVVRELRSVLGRMRP